MIGVVLKNLKIMLIILASLIMISYLSCILIKDDAVDASVSPVDDDNKLPADDNKMIVSLHTKDQDILSYLEGRAEKNDFELRYHEDDSDTLTMQGMCPVGNVLVNSTHTGITYLFVLSFVKNCFEENKEAEIFYPVQPEIGDSNYTGVIGSGNYTGVIDEGENY